ncbi:transcription factor S [Methanobrevibacter filiformis]|uniref:Transcription factor S n=1 Tax=Methanobrevibacter filiformis TaxID=55758 RepID=A0A162FDF1_9EURY|nr:transcription factor S [Methanobrevibacter filiformis]KZX11395.1 transcription factor S-II (TFIIS) [Methanobrevibacter filiformis]
MEFCPKCGAMMLPNKGKFVCKCGFTKDVSEKEADQYAVSEKIESQDSVIMKGEEIDTLPTTKVTCPECGNTKAFWWLRQTRSADEAETRFLRCTECRNTWREYD